MDDELPPEIRCKLDMALQAPMPGDMVMLDALIYEWTGGYVWMQVGGTLLVGKETMKAYDALLRVVPFKFVDRTL